MISEHKSCLSDVWSTRCLLGRSQKNAVFQSAGDNLKYLIYAGASATQLTKMYATYQTYYSDTMVKKMPGKKSIRCVRYDVYLNIKTRSFIYFGIWKNKGLLTHMLRKYYIGFNVSTPLVLLRRYIFRAGNTTVSIILFQVHGNVLIKHRSGSG